MRCLFCLSILDDTPHSRHFARRSLPPFVENGNTPTVRLIGVGLGFSIVSVASRFTGIPQDRRPFRRRYGFNSARFFNPYISRNPGAFTASGFFNPYISRNPGASTATGGITFLFDSAATAAATAAAIFSISHPEASTPTVPGTSFFSLLCYFCRRRPRRRCAGNTARGTRCGRTTRTTRPATAFSKRCRNGRWAKRWTTFTTSRTGWMKRIPRRNSSIRSPSLFGTLEGCEKIKNHQTGGWLKCTRLGTYRLLWWRLCVRTNDRRGRGDCASVWETWTR